MNTNMNAVNLDIDHLTFRHPHRAVFTDWSARFGPGVSVVCGGDGSGKSTLLRLMAGALPAVSGRLALGGCVLAEQPAAYRAQVFWCDPVDPALDDLGARAYLAHHRQAWPAWDDAVLADDLEALGLTPHLDKPLYALSTGTRRKLRLAAGLASGAALTLFDDPLAALDRRSAAHVLDRLEGLALAESPSRIVVVAHHDEALDGVPLAALVRLPDAD